MASDSESDRELTPSYEYLAQNYARRTSVTVGWGWDDRPPSPEGRGTYYSFGQSAQEIAALEKVEARGDEEKSTPEEQRVWYVSHVLFRRPQGDTTLDKDAYRKSGTHLPVIETFLRRPVDPDIRMLYLKVELQQREWRDTTLGLTDDERARYGVLQRVLVAVIQFFSDAAAAPTMVMAGTLLNVLRTVSINIALDERVGERVITHVAELLSQLEAVFVTFAARFETALRELVEGRRMDPEGPAHMLRDFPLSLSYQVFTFQTVWDAAGHLQNQQARIMVNHLRVGGHYQGEQTWREAGWDALNATAYSVSAQHLPVHVLKKRRLYGKQGGARRDLDAEAIAPVVRARSLFLP